MSEWRRGSEGRKKCEIPCVSGQEMLQERKSRLWTISCSPLSLSTIFVKARVWRKWHRCVGLPMKDRVTQCDTLTFMVQTFKGSNTPGDTCSTSLKSYRQRLPAARCFRKPEVGFKLWCHDICPQWTLTGWVFQMCKCLFSVSCSEKTCRRRRCKIPSNLVCRQVQDTQQLCCNDHISLSSVVHNGLDGNRC